MAEESKRVDRRKFLETSLAGTALLGAGTLAGGRAQWKHTGTSTVYASSAGIVLDSVTEQTSQIQAIFDSYGSAGKALRFVMDGNVVTDNLVVWSNTIIETLPGCMWMKKGAPCSGLYQFTNKHHIAGPNTPVDHDITIIGGYFDGNRRGNAANSPNWSYSPQTNQHGWVVPIFAWYGVNRVRMYDITAYDPPCFVVNFANANDTSVDGLVMNINPDDYKLYGPGPGRMEGNNGIQCEGYVTNGFYRNLDIQVSDDAVALNANDAEDLPDCSCFDPAVVGGPISNITVDGLIVRGLAAPHNHARIARLLSATQPIHNVTFRNVKGTAFIGIQLQRWEIPTPLRGSFKNIRFSDINVEMGGSDQANPVFTLQVAEIDQLHISDCQFNSVPGSPSAPIRLAKEGTINDLFLSNLQCNGFEHMIEVNGSIDNLTLNGHCLRGGEASVLLDGGTVSRLRAAASNTPLLVSNRKGALTSRKTDGTEDA